MPRPIHWFRLPRGKVWHVSLDDNRSLCGEHRESHTAERVGEHPPLNARICPDCVRSTLHLYSVAQAAQMGDPRREDDVAYTEPLCGTCSHSLLDHDVDSGRCTVTSDDPDVDWAECPCLVDPDPGLLRTVPL